MLRLRIRTKFNSREVKSKTEDASFRSLGHAGGAIRLTARSSIRRSKKPSRPGQAPHTPTGHLKRVIGYGVDKEKNEAAIGPTNEYARTIWHLHEFGGTVRPRPRLFKQRKFRIGQFGTVRKVGPKQFVRVKLKTAAQVQRANKLVRQENAERIANAKRPRKYAKRPFMGPALEKMRDRLPKFWKNSVKA